MIDFPKEVREKYEEILPLMKKHVKMDRTAEIIFLNSGIPTKRTKDGLYVAIHSMFLYTPIMKYYIEKELGMKIKRIDKDGKLAFIVKGDEIEVETEDGVKLTIVKY
jgi:hypothetical protein